MAKRIKMETWSDTIFNMVNYTGLFIILILAVYPIIFVFSASISNPDAVWSGQVWLLPKDVSFEGYVRILQDKNLWMGYKNTIFYTVAGVVINLFMTLTAAYPLSRKDFYVRNTLMGLYTFTMFFGGGLIPTYLMIRSFHMIDSFWVMIIPNAVTVYNIIITRTFFQTSIPSELREAASIDGCTNTKFFTRVVLPLSTPIIAVMTLFYGVAHWNAFFNGLIYLNNPKKYPLQLILRGILLVSQVSRDMLNVTDATTAAEEQRIAETVKYGIIIVSSIPVLMMYPFVQKYFVKGVMVGAIKG